MAIITLKEYATRHGLDPVATRHKAQRGGYKTAHKFGRDWVIDEDEPNLDNRVKSGKYVNWRAKLGQKPGLDQVSEEGEMEVEADAKNSP